MPPAFPQALPLHRQHFQRTAPPVALPPVAQALLPPYVLRAPKTLAKSSPLSAAAGAVVVKPVAPGEIVGGVPARTIGQRGAD